MFAGIIILWVQLKVILAWGLLGKGWNDSEKGPKHIYTQQHILYSSVWRAQGKKTEKKTQQQMQMPAKIFILSCKMYHNTP